MGCCVSTNKGSASAKANASSPKKKKPNNSRVSLVKVTENRAPTPVDEETVKEVLSETSKLKPPITNFGPEKQTQKPIFDKSKDGLKIDMSFPINKAEEISEVTEICSLSGSVSTTSIADKRDEEEEIPKRFNLSPARLPKNRSFSGDFKRDRVVSKSPTRQPEQSPGRRITGLAQSKIHVGRTMCTRGSRPEAYRQERIENSGRGSPSPAKRTENGYNRSNSFVGRSPSGRRKNISPARTTAASPERGYRKLELKSTEGKLPSRNETLENPLVSLECFIFL